MRVRINWAILWILGVFATACSDREQGLYEAVELSEVGSVQRMLEAGADPMALPKGKTKLPLEVAAEAGISEVAKLLLKFGAYPDSALGPEKPLWIALHHGNGLVAAELVRAGADFKHPLVGGCSPYHYALLNGDSEAVSAMLKAKADPNEEGCYGRPLHKAAEKGELHMATQLLDAGAQPNLADSSGETPIYLALEAQAIPVAKLLIQRGGDPNFRNPEAQTVLHLLAFKGDTAMVRLACELGTDPNLASSVGETPLHLAALNGHTAVVAILLAHGANPNVRTNYGLTATRIAFEKKNQAMIELLASHGGRLR